MLPILVRRVTLSRRLLQIGRCSLPCQTTACLSSSSTHSDNASPHENTAKKERPRRRRLDPMAKRPNQKCDPYGQGGKPMDWNQARSLKATVDEEWYFDDDDDDDDPTNDHPVNLIRDFIVPNFVRAAQLTTALAAVAQVHNHFPSLLGIQRRIVRRGEWQTFVRVQCHTTVLGGLSTQDFHLAMMIDVEVERPNIKALLVSVENDDGEETP